MADSGDAGKFFVPSDSRVQGTPSYSEVALSVSTQVKKDSHSASKSRKIAKDSNPPTSEELSRQNLFKFTVHSTNKFVPSDNSFKDDMCQHLLCNMASACLAIST